MFISSGVAQILGFEVWKEHKLMETGILLQISGESNNPVCDSRWEIQVWGSSQGFSWNAMGKFA